MGGISKTCHRINLLLCRCAPQTQKEVNQILSEMYSDQPYGLRGNEDCGQMSVW
ncbi:MAG: glycoside hydrolase family 92 protein [Bacteroidales bacterium]|nr:glycoside hydrolase family 92 protein [Bacteroidales bacterium]